MESQEKAQDAVKMTQILLIKSAPTIKDLVTVGFFSLDTPTRFGTMPSCLTASNITRAAISELTQVEFAILLQILIDYGFIMDYNTLMRDICMAGNVANAYVLAHFGAILYDHDHRFTMPDTPLSVRSGRQGIAARPGEFSEDAINVGCLAYYLLVSPGRDESGQFKPTRGRFFPWFTLKASHTSVVPEEFIDQSIAILMGAESDSDEYYDELRAIFDRILASFNNASHLQDPAVMAAKELFRLFGLGGLFKVGRSPGVLTAWLEARPLTMNVVKFLIALPYEFMNLEGYVRHALGGNGVRTAIIVFFIRYCRSTIGIESADYPVKQAFMSNRTMYSDRKAELEDENGGFSKQATAYMERSAPMAMHLREDIEFYKQTYGREINALLGLSHRAEGASASAAGAIGAAVARPSAPKASAALRPSAGGAYAAEAAGPSDDLPQFGAGTNPLFKTRFGLDADIDQMLADEIAGPIYNEPFAYTQIKYNLLKEAGLLGSDRATKYEEGKRLFERFINFTLKTTTSSSNLYEKCKEHVRTHPEMKATVTECAEIVPLVFHGGFAHRLFNDTEVALYVFVSDKTAQTYRVEGQANMGQHFLARQTTTVMKGEIEQQEMFFAFLLTRTEIEQLSIIEYTATETTTIAGQGLNVGVGVCPVVSGSPMEHYVAVKILIGMNALAHTTSLATARLQTLLALTPDVVFAGFEHLRTMGVNQPDRYQDLRLGLTRAAYDEHPMIVATGVIWSMFSGCSMRYMAFLHSFMSGTYGSWTDDSKRSLILHLTEMMDV